MTTELSTIQETVSLPITVEQAKREWDEYQRLTQVLLDANDYQSLGRAGRFKKKSAWRKYARAFNITDRVTFEHIERAGDGFPIWARIRVQAEAPNGRTAEADHESHVTERCCPAAVGDTCPRRGWSNHKVCCKAGCSGRSHWSHPGDLPATALTRAKNRAISDLIGAGEVSAEEMQGQRDLDNIVEGEVVQPEGSGLRRGPANGDASTRSNRDTVQNTVTYRMPGATQAPERTTGSPPQQRNQPSAARPSRDDTGSNPVASAAPPAHEDVMTAWWTKVGGSSVREKAIAKSQEMYARDPWELDAEQREYLAGVIASPKVMLPEDGNQPLS